MNKLKERQVVDLRNYNQNDKQSIFRRIYESSQNNKDDNEDLEAKVFEIRNAGDVIQMIHYLLDILSSDIVINDIKNFEKIYNEAKS
jgi:hypothetical protein